ncbi:MAG: hypothetical protein ABIY55_30335 [Kofleriaceae bacterium]
MADIAARSDGSSSASSARSTGTAPGKSTLTSQPANGGVGPGKSTLTGQLSPGAAVPVVVGRAVVKQDCCLRVAPSTTGALVPSKPDWVAKGAALDVYQVAGAWLQVLHAEAPAYITGGSKYVTFTPLPPPAVAPTAPAEPAAPAEPGMLDQITSAVGSAVDTVTGAVSGAVQRGVDAATGLGAAALALFGVRPNEPTPEEDKQLQHEPIDPATGAPTDPSAPASPADIAEVDGTKHFVQTDWYGADGEKLKDPAKTTCITVLTTHAILGDYDAGGRGEAYNTLLRLAPEQRPGTINARVKLLDEEGKLVKDANGKQKYVDVTEEVPTDVQALPQIKFIPGDASCLRTARAMAADSGATIEEGSGAPTSHIQMILQDDQKAIVNEDGEPLAVNGEVAEGKARQARDTKSTEEITADAGADHLAQIQANVKLASAFMDAELAAGRAIVVGVSYTNRDGNADNVTDHWMCVYAKVGGGYAYFDPGSGIDGEGVLKPNPDKGGILEGHNAGKTYALAQVRLNQQSSGGPSPEDVNKSMKDVAADANGKLEKTKDAPAAA